MIISCPRCRAQGEDSALHHPTGGIASEELKTTDSGQVGFRVLSNARVRQEQLANNEFIVTFKFDRMASVVPI
jgi:hypothetical protein